MRFLQTQKRSGRSGGGTTSREASLYSISVLLVLLSFLVSTPAQARRVRAGWLQKGLDRPVERPVTLAVLDFGDSNIGRLAAEKLASSLKPETSVGILDREQVRAAARGSGYVGSINLSLNEARDLGAALGCDFFVLGDAQTLRRSPSTVPVYFESYASIFLVSARTGRLIRWERPSFQGVTAPIAEQALLAQLSSGYAEPPYAFSIHRAQVDERAERELAVDRETPIIQQAPDDDKVADAEGLRLPRPYRRLIPAYPASAARAEVEATVDVLVDLDATGEVLSASITRWAGFGLDEAAVATVRQLHFFPALRNGIASPIRVLLRYNFRKPPK